MDLLDKLFEKDEYITDQQRKFIFCLIRQIYEASEVNKKDIFGKNLEAFKDINDIRQGIQNKFLEFEGIIPDDLEPLKGIDDFIERELNAILSIKSDIESKKNKFSSDLARQLKKEFQKLYINTRRNFSLSSNVCSKALASAFINFLLSMLISTGIPLNAETKEVMRKGEDSNLNFYIFNCILERRCCVTLKEGADFEHYENQGSEGYDNDTGDKLMWMLSRQEHQIKHALGKDEYSELDYVHGMRGIRLTGWQKELLKYNKIHTFKAYEYKGIKEVMHQIPRFYIKKLGIKF